MSKTLGKALSEISGIPEAGIKAIWEKVKANHAKLDSCEGPHQFEESSRPGSPDGHKYRCTRCGGELDSINTDWYNQGLKHGSRAAQGESREKPL
jgi:hypothetical protein